MDNTNSNSLNSVASMSRTGYSFNTVTLLSGSVKELREFLESKIKPNQEAYLNTPVVIDISMVNYLNDLDYSMLVKTCKEYGLFLIGLSGAVNEQRANTLISMGIPVVNSSRFARMREENFKPKVITKTLEVQVPVHIKEPYEVRVPYEVKVSEPVIVINRNIRAGEQINAVDNSVVVFGNVGRTARIVASHNVFIYGDMQGEVYAGSPKNKDCSGMKDAFIYINGTFRPTLVAIAGQYQTADDMEQIESVSKLCNKKVDLKITLNERSLCYCEL